MEVRALADVPSVPQSTLVDASSKAIAARTPVAACTESFGNAWHSECDGVGGTLHAVPYAPSCGQVSLLWQFQFGLGLCRQTKLFERFRAYCTVHDGMQLLMDHADDVWNGLVVCSRQKHGIATRSPLERDWQDASYLGGHPLAWYLTVGAAPKSEERPSSPAHQQGVSFAPGVASPTTRRKRNYAGTPAGLLSGQLHAEPNASIKAVVGHILLNDMKSNSKPGVVALLDMVLTALTYLSTQPLSLTELRRIFYILSACLRAHVELMQNALGRMVTEVVATKAATSEVACIAAWDEVLSLLQPALAVSLPSDSRAVEHELPTHEDTQQSDKVNRDQRARRRVLALEPTLEETAYWFKLVQLMHVTGVPTLKGDHLLDIIAAVLANVAADIHLETPSVVNNNDEPLDSSVSPTEAIARYYRLSEQCVARPPHVNAAADMAVAFFTLGTLYTQGPHMQRDAIFSIQEVTLMLRVVVDLISARVAEASAYRARTIRSDVLQRYNAKRRQGAPEDECRLLEGEVAALTSYLRHTGMAVVNVQMLLDTMRERTPCLLEAISLQHAIYMLGHVEGTDALLMRAFGSLPVSRQHSISNTTITRDTLTVADVPTPPPPVDNKYVCSDVQWKCFRVFMVMAVCHEAVAYRAVQHAALPYPWQRITTKQQRPWGNSPRPRRGDILQALPFPMAASGVTSTTNAGYHLNEAVHPLLLPTCLPATVVMTWMQNLLSGGTSPPHEEADTSLHRASLSESTMTRVNSSANLRSHDSNMVVNQSCRSILRSLQKSSTPLIPMSGMTGVMGSDYLRRITLTAANTTALMLTTAVVECSGSLVMDTFLVADPHRQLFDAPEAD